jgi:hypothetical protein
MISESLFNSINVIEQALMNVGDGYFRVITSYSPNGIVRERVFCYELYHQLRLAMKDSALLSLCGEIDKRGHMGFEEGDRKNPDFILHNAGNFQNNELIIEVKGKLIKNQIIKDFDTIHTFIKKYEYKNGMFILYNYSLFDFRVMFHKWSVDMIIDFTDTMNSIIIICKKDGYCKPEIIYLKDLISNNITKNEML